MEVFVLQVYNVEYEARDYHSMNSVRERLGVFKVQSLIRGKRETYIK